MRCNLQMSPQKRLYVLGIRACGLISNSTPSSILTYTAPIFPALLSRLSKMSSRGWTIQTIMTVRRYQRSHKTCQKNTTK